MALHCIDSFPALPYALRQRYKVQSRTHASPGVAVQLTSLSQGNLNQEKPMKLNAPTQALWVIAVILGVLGLLGHFTRIATVSAYSFELLAAGFLVLVVATLYKGA